MTQAATKEATIRVRNRNKKPKKERPILGWRGLLNEESRKARVLVFGLLFLIAVSMTFTQLGFIGIGADGRYLAYGFGLLWPLTLCALLLGKGWGALFGALSGGVLLLHASFQPLDLYERYFVSILNSVVIYLCAGFLLGLLFAIALHNNPQGVRRGIYLFIVSAIVSTVMSVSFLLNAIVDIFLTIIQEAVMNGLNTSEADLPSESLAAASNIGNVNAQFFFDLLLVFVAALIACHIVARYREGRNYISARTTFRTRLFVAVTVVYLVVQAGIFTATTITAQDAAAKDMDQEIEFIAEQLKLDENYANSIIDNLDDVPVDIIAAYTEANWSYRLMDSYDDSNYIIVVFRDNSVSFSNSDDYTGTIEEALGEVTANAVRTIANTGEIRSTVFGARSFAELLDDVTSEGDDFAGELGYMRAQQIDKFLIMMARPASIVFANRSATVMWGSILALTIAAAVYISATRLLNKIMVEPIDRTNLSLTRITQGELDELVAETDTVEFASLSAGINSTVDALKGLINESEKRMERDLATAKAIQESALPRTFPPFPEVQAFDIYASMNAAKEVGGDFYDFFLMDDHTVGFLIADVSGKGIPGALFMMAAKTEIENYLSTGMAPSEAIASANKRLCANNDAGMFVTVWAATLDYNTGELTYVNAGHNFPLLRHGKNGEWEWLKKKCGLFLGTFDTAKYRQETVMLETGDELLLYTDGVNEAFSADDEEFGNDRLEAWLADNRDLNPEELVHGLRAKVAEWAEGAEQSDDITILALEYGAIPQASGSLTMPATLDHLDDAAALVASEMNHRLCPVGVQRKVEVALEEMFVNVCRYAYADKDEPGEVTVSYVYRGDPKSISIELRDNGVPFNPVTLEDPTKPSDIQEAKIGGLGIFMVKNSMDELRYEHDGEYNVTTFTKSW